MIEVGKMVNTFGIKGEIKAFPYVTYFEDLKEIYIDQKIFKIKSMRNQKNIFIIKLDGIDNINDIEYLKGSKIYISEDMKPKLNDDEYYIDDLIGMQVITDDGKILGDLDDVLYSKANDIYQVGEILLPVIDEVVKNIDFENRIITVHILEGLI